MINLEKAIKVASQMGRSTEGVKLSVKNMTKERYAHIEDAKIVRGKVKDKGYKCEIVYKDDPNKVKVFCECADFRYTFYKAINEKGGASRRLTDTENIKSKGTSIIRAISKVGVCKHILALADHL